MTEQDILRLRDLAEAGQVQFKERIVNKEDKYDIGCEMVALWVANEFVITIPRKKEHANDQVTDQSNLVTDPAQVKTDPINDQDPSKTDLVQKKTDPVNDQAPSKTDQAQPKTDPVSHQPIGNTDPVQQKTDPVSDLASENTTKFKLSKKQQDIRNYCSIPRNRQEILQRAGVTDHFYNRKKYIYDLVEAGVLERTIPENPNDPNQKYRRKQ